MSWIIHIDDIEAHVNKVYGPYEDLAEAKKEFSILVEDLFRIIGDGEVTVTIDDTNHLAAIADYPSDHGERGSIVIHKLRPAGSATLCDEDA